MTELISMSFNKGTFIQTYFYYESCKRCMILQMSYPNEKDFKPKATPVIWLKYCRYDIKHYPIQFN